MIATPHAIPNVLLIVKVIVPQRVRMIARGRVPGVVLDRAADRVRVNAYQHVWLFVRMRALVHIALTLVPRRAHSNALETVKAHAKLTVKTIVPGAVYPYALLSVLFRVRIHAWAVVPAHAARARILYAISAVERARQHAKDHVTLIALRNVPDHAEINAPRNAVIIAMRIVSEHVLLHAETDVWIRPGFQID